ncbi:hypothetical protein [Bergeyella sp. RCAD1439]|uniref:hypothetical protein n=1 Tax=Bergeyella anatis TaxID=3113737 RepID=UPI002E18125A|nr:hypothetical protein [Bergeyella sp. RCAD1439]
MVLKVLCSAENFQKKTKKKTEKKRKKESLLRGGAAWCQGFLAKYYPQGGDFGKNTECQTFTAHCGWRRKPPNLLCFFYFLETPSFCKKGNSAAGNVGEEMGCLGKNSCMLRGFRLLAAYFYAQ